MKTHSEKRDVEWRMLTAFAAIETDFFSGGFVSPLLCGKRVGDIPLQF
jgi:hypothetical protein